ncbi:MAG: formylglycine-generating enzyme family protein [Planctomycetota bacterium]|jgi:formylglycine-generating enzyme required for sulfatase activity
MKKALVLSIAVLVCISSFASADSFGTGANQFEIDFVPISGDASGANGTWIGEDQDGGHKFFSDPSHNYRMGTFEVTNDQWTKFQSSYGTVTGSPSSAYDHSTYTTGTQVPTTGVSWYEAAQFTNWLNTSKGYQAAYKFTGTQGTGNYTLGVWKSGDAGYNPNNPYRNINAIYFLPTENEWVKAAYWNGTSLQTYSNASAGDLISGSPDPTKWNYSPSAGSAPWAAGSSIEELNGTYDMMGNVWEYTESPSISGDFLSDSIRNTRGGSIADGSFFLGLSSRDYYNAFNESPTVGFRVASVPEPCSLVLLGLGGLAMRYRKR